MSAVEVCLACEIANNIPSVVNTGNSREIAIVQRAPFCKLCKIVKHLRMDWMSMQAFKLWLATPSRRQEWLIKIMAYSMLKQGRAGTITSAELDRQVALIQRSASGMTISSSSLTKQHSIATIPLTEYQQTHSSNPVAKGDLLTQIIMNGQAVLGVQVKMMEEGLIDVTRTSAIYANFVEGGKLFVQGEDMENVVKSLADEAMAGDPAMRALPLPALPAAAGPAACDGDGHPVGGSSDSLGEAQGEDGEQCVQRMLAKLPGGAHGAAVTKMCKWVFQQVLLFSKEYYDEEVKVKSLKASLTKIQAKTREVQHSPYSELLDALKEAADALECLLAFCSTQAAIEKNQYEANVILRLKHIGDIEAMLTQMKCKLAPQMEIFKAPAPPFNISVGATFACIQL